MVAGIFFYLKRKFQLKGEMCQLMYLKPGKTAAVKICLKLIFRVKSAKKDFLNKNFTVGPLLKGQSGNKKTQNLFHLAL